MRMAACMVWVAGVVCLAGCQREPEASAPVRPVLSIVLAPTEAQRVGFAGTIQPRYKTDLGFQTGGQIISFGVEVGDLVEKDQQLARLDSIELQTQVRSAEADIVRAQSQLSNAQSAEERISALVADKVSSQADLDAVRQQRETAEANVKAAEANLTKAREQLGYATLSSDLAGVVTEKDVDVGQTVSAGQKVLSVARTDVREAVVDLPETALADVSTGTAFAVVLQADPTIRTTATTREIAPQADQATRTYRVRVTLDKVTEPFRLGATVSAYLQDGQSQSTITVPRSAVIDSDGKTAVWVVDPAAKTVDMKPVQLADGGGPVAQVLGGLQAGDRIVVAGIHSLTPGQQVRITGSAE